MELIDIIRKFYRMGLGRVIDIQPSETDRRFVIGRDLVNYHTVKLAGTSDTYWRELRDIYTIDGVGETAVFPLPDDVCRFSPYPQDYVRVVKGDKTYNYVVVWPQNLGDDENANADELDGVEIHGYCGFAGGNLIFKEPFTSQSPEFGEDSQILIRHYPLPEELVDATDRLVFPKNPSYILSICAWQVSLDDKVTPDRQDSLEALYQSDYDDLIQNNANPGKVVERNEIGGGFSFFGGGIDYQG